MRQLRLLLGISVFWLALSVLSDGLNSLVLPWLLLDRAADGPTGPTGPATVLGLLTFAGLVVASVFYSLPFMVQPILNSMQTLGERPLEAAATLRASPLDTFFSVVLPLCRPGLVTGCIMSFAHTVGEFGVVLMVGGNIPGVTRVVSVQIFDHVEALEYADAHRLAAVMLAFSFSVLLALQVYSARQARKGPA